MKKKLKNKKTKMNKKHKMLKSNCPGVYWDITLMLEELGPALTMQFIESIENDRIMRERQEKRYLYLDNLKGDYTIEFENKKKKKFKDFKDWYDGI